MASPDARRADYESNMASSSDHRAPVSPSGNKAVETVEESVEDKVEERVERVFPIRIQIPTPHRNEGQEEQTDLLADSIATSPGTSTPRIAAPRSMVLEDQRWRSSQGATAPSVSVNTALQRAEGQAPDGKRYITNRLTYLPSIPISTLPLPLTSTPFPSPSPETRKTYRCEDEPIHIPGAIQRFGALVAVREDPEDRSFLVRVVSENSHSVLGLEPEALFQLSCFTSLLNLPHRNEFIVRAQALRVDTSRSHPDVFSISLAPGSSEAPIRLLSCAIHFNAESDLFICEFELDRDLVTPEHPGDSSLPPEPVHILNDECSEADRLLSTTCKSKPLHSLEMARASSRQLTPMDSFQVQMEIQAQLASATDLPQLGDAIVGLVHDLTGFHRVMVYQFDDTAAGSVMSELIDARASKDLYRGLHFPASDIPKQARELYMINTIRLLYDRDEPTARFICRTFDDAKIPLNLQHSYLRAMSPIHLKYLANMGVQASMSISLIADNKLWGLISCHNYGPNSGVHTPLAIREICRGLGNIASSNIQKLLFLSRVAARRPLTKSPPKVSPFSYVTSSSADLLNMFGADFGFLAIRGEARTIGTLVAYSEAIALLQYIRQRAQPGIYYSHAISKDFADLHYSRGFSTISGMLVIPLSLSGTDFLVFFRKGKLKEIIWAGNPYETKVAAGTSRYLEPRSSFKRWSETVVGTSREWAEDEVESAAVLTTLYGRFIEVWRQKEAIVQKNRMTRLLIRNAGHEVRTPLNSIINYLEVALEEELEERARYHLQRSLQASKSLVFVVNDLLNLTEAEVGDFQVHEDNINLRSMVSEAAASFTQEASRRNLNIRIEDDEAVPQVIRCDPSGLRQVISNLLANTIQSAENGDVTVRLEHVHTTQANTAIKISFLDNGIGLSEEQLNSIFQDFEQILDDDKTPASDEQDAKEKESELLHIGLGLATVARFVRLHAGQISMSSEGKGKGTKVTITVPFRKALDGDFSRRRTSSSMADIALPTPPEMKNPSKTPRSPGSASSSSTQLSAIESATSLISPGSSRNRYPFPVATSTAQDSRPKFNILVAEDNPLNSRLLETRLKKRGHAVRVVVDGQACFDAFKAHPEESDVILMDIQNSPANYPIWMPILDGMESTRLIRSFEKSSLSPTATMDSTQSISLSPRVAPYGRIPIIVVSASLSEQKVQEYIEIGFDGWILKPIDFMRLEAILVAIEDEQTREILLYGAGNWEKGGWFKKPG